MMERAALSALIHCFQDMSVLSQPQAWLTTADTILGKHFQPGSARGVTRPYVGLRSDKVHLLTLTGMQRHDTNELGRSTKNIRSSIENSSFFRGLLKTIGVLAVSMVMADGVLTPAQSVLGAVQGLSVVKPDIDKSTVVGVTCAILVLLFVVQPLGISKLTMVFSPIVMVWLLLNAGFGVYNLARYDHRISFDIIH